MTLKLGSCKETNRRTGKITIVYKKNPKQQDRKKWKEKREEKIKIEGRHRRSGIEKA